METIKAKKPFSVFILQILLVIICISLAAVMALFVIRIGKDVTGGFLPSQASMFLVPRLVLFIYACVTLLAFYRRKAIGRWLGMILILFVAIGMIYFHLFVSPEARAVQLERGEYNNLEFGGIMESAIQGLIWFFLFLSAYRFGFSSTHRSYFCH